jgi:hypothetical protein
MAYFTIFFAQRSEALWEPAVVDNHAQSQRPRILALWDLPWLQRKEKTAILNMKMGEEREEKQDLDK